MQMVQKYIYDKENTAAYKRLQADFDWSTAIAESNPIDSKKKKMDH